MDSATAPYSSTVTHGSIQEKIILRVGLYSRIRHICHLIPHGIRDLRSEDLIILCGSKKQERKLHERIYDYDNYNDLGNPDKSKDLVRPVFSAKEWPYHPRRCRTGRKPTKTVYVPRDETFEEIKQNSFSAGGLKALFHNLIPLIAATLSSSDVPLTNFSDLDKLYFDGVVLKDEAELQGKAKKLNSVMSQVFTVGDKLLKYDTAIIKRDRFSWLRDMEFARQALAGVNPVTFELLKELPIVSKLDPATYGHPECGITKELIERELCGVSVEEAIMDKKLFIIDYHDILLPFIEKINSLPDRKAYASRTVFYYTPDGILIQLSSSFHFLLQLHRLGTSMFLLMDMMLPLTGLGS